MIDMLKLLSSIQFDHPQAEACNHLLSVCDSSAGSEWALQRDMGKPSLHSQDGCLKGILLNQHVEKK